MLRKPGSILPVVLISFSLLFTTVSNAADNKWVKGGFEMSIFFDVQAGYQHFSDDPITEIAYDNSTAGPLGESLSSWPVGFTPIPGHGVFGTFVQKVELDMMKRFGDRVRLRADISFGRAESGSYTPGVTANHAYIAVRLTDKYNVQLRLGRFGLQPGYEPFRSYDNDSASWSILWRGNLYPPSATGVQLSADVTDHFSFYFVAANGTINDSVFKGNTLPIFESSLVWTWGSDAKPNQLVVTPWIGPESGENRPLTYGGDVTLTLWEFDRWKIGLEACYQRDNATALGVNTDYYAGLVNVRYDLTPNWYLLGKYVFAKQTAPGNGVLNLTGAEQNIHESLVGVGYQLTDSAKIKGEFRFDIVDPAAGATQYVPGAVMSYAWLF
jgi:hypothetical protein